MSTPEGCKVFGLLGYPLKHTLSPLMHNAVFAKENIPAVYVPLEVKPQDLKEAVLGLRALNFAGVNVTIPHKEKIIQYLDTCDKHAKIIGAVNTIKRDANGKLTGYNTDGFGFIESLKKFEFNTKDKKVILLGAGGAAKAVSAYLADSGVRAIHIYDVDVMKAISLAERLGNNFNASFQVATKIEELPFKEAQLLINATPMGLNEADPLVIDVGILNKETLVYDLVYNPPETKLIRAAKEKGIKACNGLWMLIYQGAVAENIWQGLDINSVSLVMYEALKKEKFIK